MQKLQEECAQIIKIKGVDLGFENTMLAEHNVLNASFHTLLPSFNNQAVIQMSSCHQVSLKDL